MLEEEHLRQDSQEVERVMSIILYVEYKHIIRPWTEGRFASTLAIKCARSFGSRICSWFGGSLFHEHRGSWTTSKHWVAAELGLRQLLLFVINKTQRRLRKAESLSILQSLHSLSKDLMSLFINGRRIALMTSFRYLYQSLVELESHSVDGFSPVSCLVVAQVWGLIDLLRPFRKVAEGTGGSFWSNFPKNFISLGHSTVIKCNTYAAWTTSVRSRTTWPANPHETLISWRVSSQYTEKSQSTSTHQKLPTLPFWQKNDSWNQGNLFGVGLSGNSRRK